MFIIGAQANGAALRAGLGCVFHKVHDHLHQLINIPQGRGQGWVIFIVSSYAPQIPTGPNGARDPRYHAGSRAVGWVRADFQLFDLFKQFHNAPRFFDDQIGQLKVLGLKPHGQ